MSNERKDEIIEKEPASAKKSFRFSCAVLSITALIIAGIYSYGYGIIVHKQLTALAIQHQNQLQQLQSDLTTIKEQENAAQETLRQYADEIKNLKKAVNDVSPPKQGSQQKWLIDEARYYVKLANDTLQFSRNIPLTVSLLKMADQEIKNLTDSRWVNVRQTLATDIAHLQGTPQLDVAGVYMKLTTLSNQFDQLPWQTGKTPTPAQATTTSAEHTQLWQRGLHSIWQALQSIVVVRHQTDQSVLLIMPEQKTLLYQNLRAMVSQAIWALLHQQPVIYQDSLRQIIASISRYFAMDSAVTRAVLNELTQLEKITLSPPIPALQTTVQAFNGA